MSRKLLMYNKAKIVYIKNTTNAGFFKVGVGDDVDYSDEVNDGISTLALKGNTKVVDVDGNEVSIGTTGAKLVSVGDLQDDGKYRVEILSTGKNLFDVNDASLLIRGLSGSTGTITSSDKFWTVSCKVYYGKTYIVTKKPSSRLWINSFDHKPKIGSVRIGNVYGADFSNKAIITIDNPRVKYITIYTINEAIDGKILPKDLNIQVQEGSTETNYEPYKSNKTQILLNKPLMSTPTKQDVLEEDGTITRECNSYTITGDENWVVRQTFTNHILYNCSYVPLNSFRDYKNSDKKMKCDALPCFNGDGEDEEFIICRANGDGFVIGLNKSKASNLTEFKAWLKQTKVNVVYERYTKTTEKINPVNIGIFKGGHVSINTTVAPAESIHSVNLK